MRTMTTVLISAALLGALTGCDPTPAPAPSPETSSPKPVVTVEPTEEEPALAALTIPDCEALLPITLARSTFADSTEFLGETTATEYYPWYQLPAVTTAIGGVTVARACWWGVPNSDGAFSLLVAEIDPTVRASIEGALDAEGFSSVSMGTVTARENERDGEYSYEAETHLFTGTVWILADNGSLDVSGAVAGSALDAMRTANPTMGL